VPIHAEEAPGGASGEAATAGTAGIRKFYACRMIPTEFFEATVVSTARAACLMKPDELRQRRAVASRVL
jgi:hypothetical protein